MLTDDIDIQPLEISHSEFLELFGDSDGEEEKHLSFNGFDNKEPTCSVTKRSQRARKNQENISPDESNPYKKVYLNYSSRRNSKLQNDSVKSCQPSSIKHEISTKISHKENNPADNNPSKKSKLYSKFDKPKDSIRKPSTAIEPSKKFSNTFKIAKNLLSKAHKVKHKPVVTTEKLSSTTIIRSKRERKIKYQNDFVYDKKLTKKRKYSDIASPLCKDEEDTEKIVSNHKKVKKHVGTEKVKDLKKILNKFKDKERKGKESKICQDHRHKRRKQNIQVENSLDFSIILNDIEKRKKEENLKYQCETTCEEPNKENIFEKLKCFETLDEDNLFDNVFTNLKKINDSVFINEDHHSDTEYFVSKCDEDSVANYEVTTATESHELMSVKRKKKHVELASNREHLDSLANVIPAERMKLKAVKYHGEIRFMNAEKRLVTFCGECKNCTNDKDCQKCLHCRAHRKHKSRLLPCYKKRCLRPIIGIKLSMKDMQRKKPKEDIYSDAHKKMINNSKVKTESPDTTISMDSSLDEAFSESFNESSNINNTNPSFHENHKIPDIFVKSPIKPKLRSAITYLTTKKDAPKRLPTLTMGNNVLLPWPNDNNEDAAWVSGHHLCFTKPMRIPLLGLCFLCASAGKGKMYRCSSCCECFHPYCLDIEPIENKEWYCDRCKRCIVCGLKENLLMCDKCHDCYHGDCLGPFYQRDTEGIEETWVCGKCVVCIKCGAKQPGKSKNSRWTRNFSMCEECDYNMKNGNFCPICQEVYDENDDSLKMMFCLHCECWIHMECEGITRDDYEILADLPESIPYICKLCSTHDQKKIFWYREVKDELHSGFSKIFYDIITHIHYKTISSFSAFNKIIAQCISQFDELIIRLEAKAFTCVTDFYDAGMSVFNKLINIIVHKVDITPLAESIIELFDKSVMAAFPWFVKEAVPDNTVNQNQKLQDDDKIHPRKKTIDASSLAIHTIHTSNIQHDHAYNKHDGIETDVKLPITHIFDKETVSRYCLFCSGHGDGDESGAGRLLYAGMNEWVHINCALWSAEVYEDEQGRLKQVNEALKRGNKLKCDHCSRIGASIGCCFLKCIRSYHFPCAKEEGVTFLDDKRIYCREHTNKSDPKLILEEKQLSVPRRVLVDLTRFKTFKGIQHGVDMYSMHVTCGNLSLQELGELSKESDLKHFLVPHGYRMSRMFWSTNVPAGICKYTCEVRLPSDNKKVVVDHTSIPEKTYCHDMSSFQKVIDSYKHSQHCAIGNKTIDFPIKRKLHEIETSVDNETLCSKCLFLNGYQFLEHSEFLLNLNKLTLLQNKKKVKRKKSNSSMNQFSHSKMHFPLYTNDSTTLVKVKEEVIDDTENEMSIEKNPSVTIEESPPIHDTVCSSFYTASFISSLINSVNESESITSKELNLHASQLMCLSHKPSSNLTRSEMNTSQYKVSSSIYQNNHKSNGYYNKYKYRMENNTRLITSPNKVNKKPSIMNGVSPVSSIALFQAIMGGPINTNASFTNNSIVDHSTLNHNSLLNNERIDLIKPRNNNQLSKKQSHVENKSSHSFLKRKLIADESSSETNNHSTTTSAMNAKMNREFLFMKLKSYLKRNPQSIQIADKFSSNSQGVPIVNLTDKNSNKNLICYSAQLPEDLWNELIEAGIAQADIQKVIQSTGKKTFFGCKQTSLLSTLNLPPNIPNHIIPEKDKIISLTGSVNELYRKLCGKQTSIQQSQSLFQKNHMSEMSHQTCATKFIPSQNVPLPIIGSPSLQLLPSLPSAQTISSKQVTTTTEQPLSTFKTFTKPVITSPALTLNSPIQGILTSPIKARNINIQNMTKHSLNNSIPSTKLSAIISPTTGIMSTPQKPVLASSIIPMIATPPKGDPKHSSSVTDSSLQYRTIAPRPSPKKIHMEIPASYCSRTTAATTDYSGNHLRKILPKTIVSPIASTDSNILLSNCHRKNIFPSNLLLSPNQSKNLSMNYLELKDFLANPSTPSTKEHVVSKELEATTKKIDFNIKKKNNNKERHLKMFDSLLRTNGNKEVEKSLTKLKFVLRNEEGLHIESNSIEELWKDLIGKVNDMRLSVKLSPLQVDTLDAYDFLGVSREFITYLIEQLPGGHKCRKYRFQHHLPHVSENEDDIVANPTGCARSEIYRRDGKTDLFAWLASPYRVPPKYMDDSQEDEVFGPQELPTAMKYRLLKNMAKNNVGVYRSSIQGRGLFCKKPIEAGEMIIEYSGEKIRAVLTDRREKFYDEKGYGCYMFRIDDMDVVDATLRGNAARFINHSCEPNCFSRIISVDGRKKIVIFASRRINAGEELTYDYKFALEDDKLPCYCGAKKCRKYLN